LLTRVGLGPRKFVEFGFGTVENNTLGFALRHRASGLYLDGSDVTCRVARRTWSLLGRKDINVTHAWLNTDNIDRLIRDGIGPGEVDVLSIDVDGNDYWLWQAIHCISPRITVVEYNASFGPEIS